MQDHDSNSDPGAIQLPRPTAWPVVLALGISLMMAGLVTKHRHRRPRPGVDLPPALSAGFSRSSRTRAHEPVPVTAEEVMVTSARTLIPRHVTHVSSEARRKILPIETFRITTGIRGGIAGGPRWWYRRQYSVC